MSGLFTGLSGVLASAGAAPIVPTDVAGLKVWLKAQGQSYSDGDSVTTWTDGSGLSNNVASSGLNSPIFKTSIIGGRAVMRLSGTDARFTSSGSLGLSQPDTVFCVINHTAANFGRVLDSTSRQLIDVDVTTGFGVMYAAGATNITGATNINGAFHVLSCVFNGASSGLWVDKVSDAHGTLDTAGLATFYVGSDNTGASTFAGDIAELIIYDSALSTGNRQGIENYLGTYYGLF